MKKIGIVAFTDYPNDFKSNKNLNRLKSLHEISEYANANKVTHVLFPGSTLYYKNKDNLLAKKHLQVISKLFINQSIILELNSELKADSKLFGLYCIEKGIVINQPIIQLFASSSDDENLYSQLWHQTFNTKERIVTLDGITFLIWVCGEMNFLKNIQSENNLVKGFRYKYKNNNSLRNLKYDVFFNPTHNMLTNLYNKYKERLKFMSKSSRYAIISLNVKSSQIQRNGAILAFHKQKEILTSSSKKKWFGDAWVMETLDYKE